MFTWYWLADLCAAEGIRFVLGHALYMKAIHGGKAKNDRIDAHTIAVLLRGGMLPQASVYPAAMRATRDLLRRRLHFTRKRAELLTHIANTNSQYNLPVFGKKLTYRGNRTGVVDRFAEAGTPTARAACDGGPSPPPPIRRPRSSPRHDSRPPRPAAGGPPFCTSQSTGGRDTRANGTTPPRVVELRRLDSGGLIGVRRREEWKVWARVRATGNRAAE